MKLYAAHLDLSSIANEFKITLAFDISVTVAAAQAHDRFSAVRKDMRDILLVTIDPKGSMTLDQAVFTDKPASGSGYLVYCAVADVASFVDAGGVIERESLSRGQTIYLPAEPVRLHPPELSDGEASLLPGVDRPAV